MVIKLHAYRTRWTIQNTKATSIQITLITKSMMPPNISKRLSASRMSPAINKMPINFAMGIVGFIKIHFGSQQLYA